VAQLRHRASGSRATRVVAPVPPEPLNEPLNEPMNEPIEREAAPDGAAPTATASTNSEKKVGRGKEGGTLHHSDNPSSPRGRNPRGTRLSEDWQPSEADKDFAGQLLGAGRVGPEAEHFRDYYLAAPGERGVKVDWPATWHNWCRKAVRWDRGRRVDESKSVSAAAGRLAEAARRGEFTFGPRPSLIPTDAPKAGGKWYETTVAEAMERVGTGKATAADVRLLKDHNKLEYSKALKNLGSGNFLRTAPGGESFTGPTIDLVAESSAEPAKLTDADVEAPKRDEAQCARMREKLRSIGIRTDASRDDPLAFMGSSL
jgi:hypothetical protein